MNYTKHTLQKIEDLMGELQYTVRYEKGSFQSGYCLVENHKIAVVNRFFETEGRINTLIDILDKIDINMEGLSEKGLKTYKDVRKKTAEKDDKDAMEKEVVVEKAEKG